MLARAPHLCAIKTASAVATTGAPYMSSADQVSNHLPAQCRQQQELKADTYASWHRGTRQPTKQSSANNLSAY
jgi:hypothetical protein